MSLEKRKGVFTQTTNTVVNIFALGENASGLTNDILEVARENLTPAKIEARVEAARVLQDGLKELVEMGMNEEEAKKFLMNGMI
jgi:hypothetical protein